jgi:hypothetical protein
MASLGRRDGPAGPPSGGRSLNVSSIPVLAGIVVEASLLAFVGLRGRRAWLQVTYAACALSYLVLGASYVGMNERILAPPGGNVILGIMLLANALSAILVLRLIHGETLTRQRSVALLLLAPVPVLTALAPAEGWTAATAYDGNAVGGFLVVCLGVALAESIYARTTSRLLGTHAFWLSFGIVVLIVAGPVYAYEVEVLRQAPVSGANLASPIALACFALVAVQGDPFRIVSRPAKGRTNPGRLASGDAFVFEETRPKYAFRTARDESLGGRATLVIGRTPPVAAGAAYAAITPSRYAALRALTTASEFLGSSPGGLVVIADFADLAVLSEWAPTLESAVRLRHVARATGSTVIVSTSRLADSERRSLGELRFSWWTLPDPAGEIDAILAQSFGAGGSRLVAAFCRSHGLRHEDVTTDHVPALVAFLEGAISELSGVVAGTAGHGLRAQLDAAAGELRAFAAQGAVELAHGNWPSRTSSEPGAEWLVTAADYWKGKEMEELFAAADEMGDREPLFEKAKAVFVEQLGEGGERLLRAQLARLGKEPEDLDRTDLARIADRTSVDLGSLADVVDIPEERDRIQKQIESIRQRLELIVGDDR